MHYTLSLYSDVCPLYLNKTGKIVLKTWISVNNKVKKKTNNLTPQVLNFSVISNIFTVPLGQKKSLIV